MISHKYRCIFIHIPKNAGTSIETKLCEGDGRANLSPDHRTIRDLEPVTIDKILKLYQYDQLFSLFRRGRYYIKRKQYGSYYSTTSRFVFETYYKFTFVRNPWSRVYSWYKNVMLDKRHQRRYHIPPECSFKAFMKNYFPGQPALRSQLYWLVDSNHRIPLDFIGRFERLSEDFSRIAEIIGISNAELPWIRQSSETGHYADAYDPEMKEMVRRAYQEEIACFNFTFGE
jgi:hypothetical protein